MAASSPLLSLALADYAEFAELLSGASEGCHAIDMRLPFRVLAKNFDKAITDQVEDAYKEHRRHPALGEGHELEDNGDSVTVVTDMGRPTLQITQFWALAHLVLTFDGQRDAS